MATNDESNNDNNNTNGRIRSLDLYRMAFSITDDLIAAEGETNDELEARIDQFFAQAENKLEAQRYMKAQADKTARDIRDEAARLVNVARRLERVSERAKYGAKTVLEARVEAMGWDDGRRYDSDNGSIYLQKSRKLEIEDEKALILVLSGSPYTKTTERLDKTAIKKAIESRDESLLSLLDAGHLEGQAATVWISDNLSVVFK